MKIRERKPTHLRILSILNKQFEQDNKVATFLPHISPLKIHNALEFKFGVKIDLQTRGGVEDTRLEAKDIKNLRPRTDPLEAQDRNARGQGHRRKCSPKKKVFKNFFQAIYEILTIQKIVLSSRAIFEDLRFQRPRTSNCLLEDSTSATNY